MDNTSSGVMKGKGQYQRKSEICPHCDRPFKNLPNHIKYKHPKGNQRPEQPGDDGGKPFPPPESPGPVEPVVVEQPAVGLERVDVFEFSATARDDSQPGKITDLPAITEEIEKIKKEQNKDKADELTLIQKQVKIAVTKKGFTDFWVKLIVKPAGKLDPNYEMMINPDDSDEMEWFSDLYDVLYEYYPESLANWKSMLKALVGLKFVASTGMLALTKIANYADNHPDSWLGKQVKNRPGSPGAPALPPSQTRTDNPVHPPILKPEERRAPPGPVPDWKAMK